MDFLAAQGFVVALGFGHFADSNGIPLDDLRRWARYLVARYGESSEGTLKQLDPMATYEARWFDPRKGEYAGDVLMINPEKGVLVVPPKPTAEDSLLRVEKRTKGRNAEE